MMLRRRGAFSILQAASRRRRLQTSQLVDNSLLHRERDGNATHCRILARYASTEHAPLSTSVSAPEVPLAWRKFPASGQVFQEEVQVGNVKVGFETGKLARFAAGAVVVGVAETKVLVTVVADHKLDASRDFLPLQVEYREKQYAQGKIPATFMRREGAPKERELLCGRLIDRSVRPLFPRGFFYDSQIIANVLSSDGEQDPDVLAVNAASAALMISDIPWKGPIGCVRIGRVKGEFVVNPNMDDLSLSDLNLVYACTSEKTVMIETQAREISNQDYVAALHLAHAEATKLIPPQLELAARVAPQKRPLPVLTVPLDVLTKVKTLALSAIESVMGNPEFGKFERGQTLGKIEEEVKTLLLTEGDEVSAKLLPYAFDAVKKEVLRRNIFDKGIRVDGRGLTQVRELQCEAGSFPALHGSSLFSRGNTQVLCTVTMGAPDDAQRLDSLVGIDRKRFMVHYGFPPFSINEVGRTGGLNRREVGHGTLAEKALVALLPPEEDFPYSVRVTSECLASDGSSSMATVCGGSIALMDAGIQLRAHVGAVSVGLVSVSDPDTGRVTDYRILTDILGLEDHLGDMDFKIAGTRKGITAIQLDIKPAGVPLHILCEALEPALVGRSKILDFMEQVISTPRDSLRENLPRSGTMNIQQDSIGRLIGPQGSNIKNIQRVTEARISITGDGVVTIFARDQASFDQAKKMVEASVGKEVEVGGTYTARVLAIKDFGAFMELNGGYQGLLHISEIAHERIERVSDYLAVGQELGVVCIGRDLRGNLKLSRKMTLPMALPPPITVPPVVPSLLEDPAADPKDKQLKQGLAKS